VSATVDRLHGGWRQVGARREIVIRLGALISVALYACVLGGCGPSPGSGAEGGEVTRSEEAPTEPAPDESPADDEQHYSFGSYKDVDELFQRLGYTPERWSAGIREVPRVYITNIPGRWRSTVSKEVSVQTKKRIFFRALGPLALRANELILEDRKRVQGLVEVLDSGKDLASADHAWLAGLAVRYKCADSDEPSLDRSTLTELSSRVDIVPVSLALSQAAEESGWGTSRFAAEGNALFGQWTWSEKAINPDQQRAALGNYGIAAFETPLQSVLAYMNNLNTHRAYRGLRVRRAELRSGGERMSGRVLAETLTSYSERGPEYVKSLHAIMRVNHLDPTDDACLDDGPTIYLVPTGEGAE